MRYVMAFSGRRGPTLLDDEATPETVADDCREAALGLLNGAAGGWDKIDLVLWLTGPYARASRYAARGERVASMAEDDEIAVEAIEDLVARTRRLLLASLEEAVVAGGGLDFAEEAIERGLARPAIGADGETVWIPVDGSRMRLHDRIRGLFVADYLNRPETYEQLYVCDRCENVVFDAGAKRLGACNAHKRTSGVVPRGGEDLERAAGED
jgi:hypothetical protein